MPWATLEAFFGTFLLEYPPYAQSRFPKATQRLLSDISASRAFNINDIRKDWRGKTLPLFDILQKYGRGSCTDIRDRVYALIGLASDFQDLNGFEVDYSKDAAALFITTMVFYAPRSNTGKDLMDLLDLKEEDLQAHDLIAIRKYTVSRENNDLSRKRFATSFVGVVDHQPLAMQTRPEWCDPASKMYPIDRRRRFESYISPGEIAGMPAYLEQRGQDILCKLGITSVLLRFSLTNGSYEYLGAGIWLALDNNSYQEVFISIPCPDIQVLKFSSHGLLGIADRGLELEQSSAWHLIQSAEYWKWHWGGPEVVKSMLGEDLCFQHIFPTSFWMSAELGIEKHRVSHLSN